MGKHCEALFTSSSKRLMNTRSSVAESSADLSSTAPTDTPKAEKKAATEKTLAQPSVSPLPKTEVSKAEVSKAEVSRADSSEAKSSKASSSKAQVSKTETAKSKDANVEGSNVESSKVESSKVEGFSTAAPPAAAQDSLNTKTLKQIFQLSPIGMTILDLSGGFLSANQSFCDAVGYTERELIMLTFTDLTHPEDVPLLRSLGEQLLEGERQHFQVETRHWSKHEKPLHVGLTVTMVRDSQQRPICFLLQV